MQKVLLSCVFGFCMAHTVVHADLLKTVNVKVGYSKIGNFGGVIAEDINNVIKNKIPYKEDFNGHRVFGLGFGLKYNFPQYFFVGLNAALENADNKYIIAHTKDYFKKKFSSKNSVNLIPVVGVSIKMFDIYAGAGISYNQIKYSQVDTRITDPNDEDFNNYKVHNWRGNFVWCAGIDMNINGKASFGIEYKKNRIKFSFVELPNSDRKKSYFKTDHHTISMAFKYKF